MKIIDFFKSDHGKTAAAGEVAAAIADIERRRAGLGPELDELGERRRQAMLADDDKAIEKIEGEQAAVARAFDKLDAQLDELRRLHEDAVERERLSGIEALYAEGLAAQKAALAGLKRYGDLAVQLRDVLLEIERHEAARKAANAGLAAAGDRRRIDNPASLVTKRSDYRADPLQGVALPNVEDYSWPHWPLSHAARLGLAGAPEIAALDTAGPVVAAAAE